MQPTGSVEQVRDAYPPAQAEPTERIDYLLRRAATVVVSEVPSILTRVAASEPGLSDLLDGVVTDMVVRVLRVPDGARSRSQTRGPFSESVTFADGAGDLVLLDAERSQLQPRTARGTRRIGSFRLRSC